MKRFLKFPFFAVPSIFSPELGLSLLAGYGMATLFSGRETGARGVLPSFVLKFRQYHIHLHHWITFSLIILASATVQFFLLSPVLFYGTLTGITAHGILQYEDWHVIIKKF